MEELAIFGGKPVRENKIFYGRQYIDQADVDAVAAVMTSDYITCGPKVKELEEHLCALTHAKYAVVVCNGTAAIVHRRLSYLSGLCFDVDCHYLKHICILISGE